MKFDELLHCDHKTGHNYNCHHFFGHNYRIVTTLEAQMSKYWHCIQNFSIGTINCLSPLLLEYLHENIAGNVTIKQLQRGLSPYTKEQIMKG